MAGLSAWFAEGGPLQKYLVAVGIIILTALTLFYTLPHRPNILIEHKIESSRVFLLEQITILHKTAKDHELRNFTQEVSNILEKEFQTATYTQRLFWLRSWLKRIDDLRHIMVREELEVLYTVIRNIITVTINILIGEPNDPLSWDSQPGHGLSFIAVASAQDLAAASAQEMYHGEWLEKNITPILRLVVLVGAMISIITTGIIYLTTKDARRRQDAFKIMSYLGAFLTGALFGKS